MRYVEYNAESPAGMAYGDNMAAVFAGLPVMKAFRKRFRGRFPATRERQLATMLRAFKEWGRETTPVVAIVDWVGLPTATEFEMFKDYFESRGVKTVICDPRALAVSRGKLHAEGTRIANYFALATADLSALALVQQSAVLLADARCSVFSGAASAF